MKNYFGFWFECAWFNIDVRPDDVDEDASEFTFVRDVIEFEVET